jgi:hypothetical protein
VIQKSGNWQEGALDLNQAWPAPKQPNLNKLGDAGGGQEQGAAGQPKIQFLILVGIRWLDNFKQAK